MSDALPASNHPAPHRQDTSFAALAYGLVAAPLAWSIQSVAGYGLASYSCYPSDAPRATPLLEHAGLCMALMNVAALVISASAMAIAWRSWSATRRERGGPASQLVDVGEGRTRFLAMCAMLTSGGFMAATLFTSIALALAPLCR